MSVGKRWSLMDKCWGILCPGASLNLETTYEQILYIDKPAFLVAVNCAVLGQIKVDYWAMLDIEMFESCYQRWLQLTVTNHCAALWIPKRWLNDIPRHHDHINNFFNKFKKETFSYGSDAPFSVPIPNIQSWWNYSLFVAIAEVITRGARVINIYGADMCGTEYFKPGFRNGRTRHNEKRWAEENAIFNIIKYECKKQDICIVRR